MAVESEKDRAIFLNPDEFGVEALYAPRDDGLPVPVDGLFDDAHKQFDPNRWPGTDYQQQIGAKFSSTGPTFACQRAHLPDGGRRRSKLTLEGVVYTVQDVQPDGTGIIVLVLTEDDPQ